jgi:hypothetical protein
MATEAEKVAHRVENLHHLLAHEEFMERARANPEGAFDIALGYDSPFTPRPPASNVDPRPASDRGRKAARDQSQPPPARNKSMLLDADPQAVKARLEKVLGPEGLEDLRRLLNGNQSNGSGDEDNGRNGNAHGEVGTDQDLDDDEDDINNGGNRTGKILQKVLELCSGRLNPGEMNDLEMLLKDLAPMAEDDPPDFAGKPSVGGALTPNAPRNGTGAPPRPSTSSMDARKQAMDAAMRIRVDTTGIQPSRRPAPPPRPRLKGELLAMDEKATASRQSFASRFPDVARIKCL